MRWAAPVWFACGTSWVSASLPAQVPLRTDGSGHGNNSDGIAKNLDRRALHGRFLHVTDFHPDRFYQTYSSTAQDSACHRGSGPAGIYGAETSECDSPFSLVNKTMEWIDRELKDKIDFVIWTGDSARHDNDEEIPRNTAQVVGLNEFMVQKMFEVFGKRDGDADDEDPNNDYIIPIIPTFGNNDVLPHNLMQKGPNSWTRTYARVWRQFIPEAQRHQFEQGGWFYAEVIPNKLAVFSLNTLYFFDSNAAADGCAAPHEPGYQQMEWLRIQLQFMRERGVKAILTGHVPPIRQKAKTSWDETCWQKYTLWLRQYRDVIVGSMYGHFNYDHFMLQNFHDLDKDTQDGRMEYMSSSVKPGDHEVDSKVSSDYFIELRETWAKLPRPPKSLRDRAIEIASGRSDKGGKQDHKQKQRQREKKYMKSIGGPYAENFAASFVSASVVPNLFPAIRIYEYNISGLESGDNHEITLPADAELEDFERIARRKKPKHHKFVVPDPPSKSSPPGPAYSPQMLSLLRYTQYFANITHINNDFALMSREDELLDGRKWKEGRHKGRKPHDKDHAPSPKPFKFELHYDTREDDVYKLPDLTMPNLVDLARRIGGFVHEETLTVNSSSLQGGSRDPDDPDHVQEWSHKKKHGRKHRRQNEPWWTFVRRAYVETMNQDEIEDQFSH